MSWRWMRYHRTRFWTAPMRRRAPSRAAAASIGSGGLGDTLFMATIDARLIALDAKTGRLLWNVAVAGVGPRPAMRYYWRHWSSRTRSSSHGRGEHGIRGFVAVRCQNRERSLALHTIPGEGEPGNKTWSGDSRKTAERRSGRRPHDQASNLTFWGIGNPGPDWNGDGREGDNLQQFCRGPDADTGKLSWHFQFSPHMTSSTSTRRRFRCWRNMTWQGRARKVMLWANRNGFFYVLDRTGQFLPGTLLVEELATLDEKWADPFVRRARCRPARAPLSRPAIRAAPTGIPVLQARKPVCSTSVLGELHDAREAGCRIRRRQDVSAAGRRGPRFLPSGRPAAQLREGRRRIRAVRAADPQNRRTEVGIQA